MKPRFPIWFSCCLLLLIAWGCSGDKSVTQTSPGPGFSDVRPAWEDASGKSVAALPAGPSIETCDRQGEQFVLHWISPLIGDLNADGSVDGRDVFLISSRFGQLSSHDGELETTPGNDCVDCNRDGTIDGADLFVAASQYGGRIDFFRLYASAEAEGEMERIGDDVPLVPGCGEVQQAAVTVELSRPWLRIAYYDSADGVESEPGPASLVYDKVAPRWPETVGVRRVVGGDGYACVYWNKAVDEGTTDVTYNIYVDTQSPVRFDGEAVKLENVDFLAVDTAWNLENEFDCRFDLEELEPDTEYWIAVRAADTWFEPNEDDNTVELGVETVSWNGELILDLKDAPDWMSSARGIDGEPLAIFESETPEPRNSREWRLIERAGGAWNVESIGVVGKSVYSQWTSLAVDPDGNPGISVPGYLYHDTGDYGPGVYMHRNHGEWEIEQLPDLEEAFLGPTSLAYSSGGNPMIALADANTLNLYIYHRYEGTWYRELVDQRGWGCSLVLDENDTPLMSYVQYERSISEEWKLCFASYTAGNWHKTVLDAEHYCNGKTALDIAPDGSYWIGYTDIHGQLMLAAHGKGGSWDMSTVRDLERVSQYHWLDAEGLSPAVIYGSWANPDWFSRLAHFKDGEWITEQPWGRYGAGTGVFVSDDGMPAVFWHQQLEDDTGRLWYSVRSRPFE